MGEAKRRKLKRTQTEPFSKELTRARFDLYTLGTRRSMARVMAEELSWWADLEERTIGVVFRDRVDDDYGWNLLARDRAGRLRWVKGDVSIQSIPRATEALRETIAHLAQSEVIAELATQGDEPNVPFDLLQVPLDADRSKLHPYFRELLARLARTKALVLQQSYRLFDRDLEEALADRLSFRRFCGFRLEGTSASTRASALT